MNEIFKMVVPYALTFVAGGAIFGGATGFKLHNDASNRVAHLEEEINSLRESNSKIAELNTELTATVERDAAIKQELGETIERQQADLVRTASLIGQTGETNKLAGEYNQEAIEFIDGLIDRYSKNGVGTTILEED